AGDSLPVSPWNITASLEWDLPLRNNVTASLHVEDAFSSGPRTDYFNNPLSTYYDPGLTPDPSTNVLNVRAAIKWPGFEVAAFLSNALDAHPVLDGSANGVDNFGGIYTLHTRPTYVQSFRHMAVLTIQRVKSSKFPDLHEN